MLENINPENTEVVEIPFDKKLQLENLQLKMMVCEKNQALAAAELHIYNMEYEKLMNE